LAIEWPHCLGQITRVKATTKRQQDMQKKDGRVDYEKLRKDGYSDRLLAKWEQG